MSSAEHFEEQSGTRAASALDLSSVTAGQDTAGVICRFEQMNQSNLCAAALTLDRLGLNGFAIGADSVLTAEGHQKLDEPINFGSLVESCAGDIASGRMEPLINLLRSGVLPEQREEFMKQVNEKLEYTGVSMGFAVDGKGNKDLSTVVIRRMEDGWYDSSLARRRSSDSGKEQFSNLRISMKDGSLTSDRTINDIATNSELKKIADNIDPVKATADISQWLRLRPTVDEAKQIFAALGTPQGDKALAASLDKAYEKFGMPGVYQFLSELNSQHRLLRKLDKEVRAIGASLEFRDFKMDDGKGFHIWLSNRNSEPYHDTIGIRWQPKQKK